MNGDTSFSRSSFTNTVRPVFGDHSKIDNANDLKSDGSVMQVESITECCILQHL